MKSISRAVLILLGGALILSGIRAFVVGTLHYRNYWGGAVFAPLAILAGLLLLVLATVKWRKFTEPAEPSKLKGKAARRARQAERTKFPIDDYKKW